MLSKIRRRDSIDFNCWTWIHTAEYERLAARLVFRGITSHFAIFKENTRKKITKGISISESVFLSEMEAAAANAVSGLYF